MIFTRNPGDYTLVCNANMNPKSFRRLQRGLEVPEGMVAVTADRFGNPVYDDDGFLIMRYWALKRIMEYSYPNSTDGSSNGNV